MMKKWLSVIVLFVSLIVTSNAFATHYWQQSDQTTPTYSATDNWTEFNQWNTASGAPTGTFTGMPAVPNPGSEIKLTTNTWMTGPAHSTVNTNVGSYTGQNLSLNGTLYVNSGANIGFNRSGSGNGLRVGSTTAGGTTYTGTVNQSAGTFSATNIYLGYGGIAGAIGTGNYVISGGSLTASSSLTVGGGRNSADTQQTIGKFTVDGASSAISVTALRVGGTDVTTTANSGTLEFKVGGSGVSAIGCTTVNLDAGGANANTALLVSLTAAPSAGNILLVDNTGAGAVTGLFDTLNGGSAAQGAAVTLSFGGTNYNYNLTYMGGTGNDIVLLIPEPATIALLGLGLLAIRRNKK